MDADGAKSRCVPPGKYSLAIEFVGGERKTVEFTLEDGEDRIIRLTR